MNGRPAPGRPTYTRVFLPVADALSALPELAAADGMRRKSIHRPVYEWPFRAAAALADRVDHVALAAVDAAGSGTYIKRSSIKGAGRGVARALTPGEYILPFFGQMAYQHLDDAVYQADPLLDVRLYSDAVLPARL